MITPKFFLVSSKATDAQIEQLLKALAITPVDVALVSRPQDVEVAKKITDSVTGLHRPIVIVADFDAPLTVITDDGVVTAVTLAADTSVSPRPCCVHDPAGMLSHCNKCDHRGEVRNS